MRFCDSSSLNLPFSLIARCRTAKNRLRSGFGYAEAHPSWEEAHVHSTPLIMSASSRYPLTRASLAEQVGRRTTRTRIPSNTSVSPSLRALMCSAYSHFIGTCTTRLAGPYHPVPTTIERPVSVDDHSSDNLTQYTGHCSETARLPRRSSTRIGSST